MGGKAAKLRCGGIHEATEVWVQWPQRRASRGAPSTSDLKAGTELIKGSGRSRGVHDRRQGHSASTKNPDLIRESSPSPSDSRRDPKETRWRGAGASWVGRAAGSPAGPVHGPRTLQAATCTSSPKPSAYGPITGRGFHRVRPGTRLANGRANGEYVPPPPRWPRYTSRKDEAESPRSAEHSGAGPSRFHSDKLSPARLRSSSPTPGSNGTGRGRAQHLVSSL